MPDSINSWWNALSANLTPIVIIGLLGQAIFMSRFLVQWIVSEKAGKSIMPTAFWWLSLGGSLLLFTYAIIKADPVFIIGQSFGFIVYSRNLILIKRDQPTTRDD